MELCEKLHSYIASFNRQDDELFSQLIPNDNAEAFLRTEIPLVDLPDRELEEIYYFRWWTFRKHIKKTEEGYIVTEFLPPVYWSGPHNSINCPSGFHIREGRWLKDSDGILKDYINFWLEGKGDAHCYSAWYAHAVLEYCTLKNDTAFAVEKLPLLVKLFEERAREHKLQNGIYWSEDNRDGMEFSISGSGLRPTINAYAYGDAIAISKIAAMAGETELQARFAQIAEETREITDRLLWDGSFYKTLPTSDGSCEAYRDRPHVAASNDAKELVGYVPWYFHMPTAGKETAFSELLDVHGFKAAFGLTTAEQRHPRFFEAHSHECLWNGPVWPFATSQVLVALSNVLRDYQQDVIVKDDYYDILLQYARAHHRTREDGARVPWIDENLHPYTGEWIARETLKEWGWPEDKGGYERGKDYNHSLFCDLILSGLLGIGVEDGRYAVSPLIPDAWDWFRVDNLWLEGKRYRVVYDKDGSHYGMGNGLFVKEY